MKTKSNMKTKPSLTPKERIQPNQNNHPTTMKTEPSCTPEERLHPSPNTHPTTMKTEPSYTPEERLHHIIEDASEMLATVKSSRARDEKLPLFREWRACVALDARDLLNEIEELVFSKPGLSSSPP